MSNQDQKPQKPKGQLNNYARFSSIAIQMFVIIGIGTFIGVKLDEYFNYQHKTFAVILSLLSVIMAVFFVIRRIIAASKENDA